MAIQLSAPKTRELKPRIVVFGVGGAGGNAVNNMIDSGLQGADFVVANTDAQQLQFAKTDKRVQLGVTITQGLGAGAHPDIGMSAAEESIPEIAEHLDGVHMVFITAGMGGGTGTGAAPVIARAARERGILTVGVVTKPFQFEGRHRMRLAEQGIADLQGYVDTLIVIPNQNLFRIANERTTFGEAFSMADQVLHSGVRSITDLMVMPGLINLDFADVRTVMTEMGKAMMGTGEATGDDRALMAAQNAIQNPLLDEVSLRGAKAVLVNVTGGLDMTLLEVDEAANAISAEVDPDANIIFGAAFDPALDGKIRVSVVATGMEGAHQQVTLTRPAPRIVEAVAPQPVAHPIAAQETAQVAATAAAPDFMAPESEELPIAASDASPSQGDLLGGESQTQPGPIAVGTTAGEPTIEDDQPLFPEPRHDERRKGGFFSLFGGRKPYEPTGGPGARATPPASPPSAPVRGPQPLPTRGNTALAAQPEMDPDLQESQEDLDIPSFLRRLAN